MASAVSEEDKERRRRRVWKSTGERGGVRECGYRWVLECERELGAVAESEKEGDKGEGEEEEVEEEAEAGRRVAPLSTAAEHEAEEESPLGAGGERRRRGVG